MERPKPPHLKGARDNLSISDIENGFCVSGVYEDITTRHLKFVVKTPVETPEFEPQRYTYKVKPVVMKTAQLKSVTILGQGPTPRQAYYDLMTQCRAWPQGVRNWLYTELCVADKDGTPPRAALQPGEHEPSLGLTSR